ncbi:poly(ADP-ribose) glycohydrolase-like [Venturia canescens]|uniref:poly(ADP-ribose) glycohydrolase-like n=1 Tax=Venturia canescens TaxID=32260 RepID=UPI001C9C6857|nr:poly(ADP-ribose) glycohydrolase-like [Venturia canescens]
MSPWSTLVAICTIFVQSATVASDYGGGRWKWYEQHPPIVGSKDHTVLFKLPLSEQGILEPWPSYTNRWERWDDDHVKMPYSSQSKYFYANRGIKRLKPHRRWEVIKEKLRQNIRSFDDFERAVSSYNHGFAKHWHFKALQRYFDKVATKEVTDDFFRRLLPKVIDLALNLPKLITAPIPLLVKNKYHAISLTQLQIASLLANAFLCTFPMEGRNKSYTSINFDRLFSAYDRKRPERSTCVMEKFKFILHYFDRVTSADPTGTITIQRRYKPEKYHTKWWEQHEKLASIEIWDRGTMEIEGANMLQVDFANKKVGGGVLSYGCVQEEMKYVIYPELIVTRLITEALGDDEALVVSGIERYSDHKGFRGSFTWTGNHVDATPRDSSRRRATFLVAIDALNFDQSPDVQFDRRKILRELNKAYVGFESKNTKNLPPIATGNWGGGAFKGNPKLKFLLQWMAATVADRPMVYFTFGDRKLRDDVTKVYNYVIDQKMTVDHLYSLLTEKQNRRWRVAQRQNLYRLIHET